MDNYVITHLHSMISNCTTNIDSITKFEEYIKLAKQNDMKAISFTEHGNCFSWYKKYKTCKENDIKFIFGIEMYITKTLNEKVRDNYHCCLYAKNNEGIKELNKMISIASDRKNGNHFYYVPRISIDEFLQLSDNIIISTACLGSILASDDEELKKIYLDYLIKNKDRCFLEIQHHSDKSQIEYNQYLYQLHKQYNIQLITGTDTHILNKDHIEARDILQKAKGIHFDNEDGWDLTFKSYNELVSAYEKQNSLPMKVVLNAIENTNILADMIEKYEFDTKAKYPKLYDDSEKVLKDKILEGIKWRNVDKYDNFNEYINKINYEFDTYKHNGAIDFLLLEEDYKSAMRKQGIEYGYSRGSVSGSVIAYLLGITEIDSIKHNLNFERFMNKERISLADVDTDWYSEDRKIVKDYLYNKKGLYCCEIVTYNTIALKGAIRDVGRALEIPLSEVDGICKDVEVKEQHYRNEYPELFKYVDLLQGVIVSVGFHPAGTVVSQIPIDEWFGTFTTSTCEYPISQLNMKEIDSLNFVKLDILGLDNIGIINQTCKLANIERLTPNNTPSNDINVWKSIREDTLGIFQWESNSATAYLKQLLSDETVNNIKKTNPNFSYMDLLSIGNGAIRPAGESYREQLAKGKFKDNGHLALNEFLAPTLGYLCFQEQIIEFLHSFCGYTMGEADIIRRGFSKKLGTEQYIPEIKKGFINTMEEKYNVSEEESEKLIVDFLQVIIDASSYLFSLNHSDPYSWIGYICGYLRYYYPLEFLTTMFNINKDDEDKTKRITEYTVSHNIQIKSPKFRYSKAEYFFNKETNTIYKGIGSIKFLNLQVGNELYDLKDNIYSSFLECLIDIKTNASINSKQLDLLVKIDFFSEFGSIGKLLNIISLYDKFYGKKTLSKDKLLDLGLTLDQAKSYGEETAKQIKNLNSLQLLIDLTNKLDNIELPLSEILQYQLEILGYVEYTNSSINPTIVAVQEININQWGTAYATFYRLCDGTLGNPIKVDKQFYNYNTLNAGDIIQIDYIIDKPKKRKVDGKWTELDEKELILTAYHKVEEL